MYTILHKNGDFIRLILKNQLHCGRSDTSCPLNLITRIKVYKLGVSITKYQLPGTNGKMKTQEKKVEEVIRNINIWKSLPLKLIDPARWCDCCKRYDAWSNFICLNNKIAYDTHTFWICYGTPYVHGIYHSILFTFF